MKKKQDVRAKYLFDTGRRADEPRFLTYYDLYDYIDWLEQQVLDLTKPKLIRGDLLTGTINKSEHGL